MFLHQTSPTSLTPRRVALWGFTLIELLVVISIIGILAALVVGTASLATWKSRLSRMETEVNNYATAIDQYKNDLGVYPPDNKLGSTNRLDYVRNPLFYELSGAQVHPGDQKFYSPNNSFEPVAVSDLHSAFGDQVQGITNSGIMDKKPPRSYLPENFIEETLLTVPAIKFLAAPLQWPSNKGLYAPIRGTRFNPIRYDSSSTNRYNRTTFDVWIEVVKGDNAVIIRNGAPMTEIPLP